MEKLVTLDHATKMVEAIEKAQDDNEAAHVWEDQLRLNFLQDLGCGVYSIEEAIEIANKILETEKFEFSRHCA